MPIIKVLNEGKVPVKIWSNSRLVMTMFFSLEEK